MCVLVFDIGVEEEEVDIQAHLNVRLLVERGSLVEVSALYATGRSNVKFNFDYKTKRARRGNDNKRT